MYNLGDTTNPGIFNVFGLLDVHCQKTARVSNIQDFGSDTFRSSLAC